MAITWVDVVKIAPALSTLAVDAQTIILAQVTLLLNASAFGAKYDTACTYFAAHLGTLAQEGAYAPGGPITSETIGPGSKSYAAPLASDPFWDTTSFGKMYRWIAKTLPGRVGFVT
jgi:hypothetical protein